MKECMVSLLVKKTKFDHIRRSRRTQGLIDEDLPYRISKKAESFNFNSLALDQSTDY